MAKTGDVEFNHNANASTTYQYMIATRKDTGEKLFEVRPKYTSPPSLIKTELFMTIKAGPKIRIADGTSNSAVMDITNVMTQLRTLIDSTTEIALNGYDNQSYKVLFDKDAGQAVPVFDETGRIVNYDIALHCWDRHQ